METAPGQISLQDTLIYKEGIECRIVLDDLKVGSGGASTILHMQCEQSKVSLTDVPDEASASVRYLWT